MKHATSAVALYAACIFLVAGCAVTSGTTFDSVVASERSAADASESGAGTSEETTEEVVQEDGAPPLRVITHPEGATVYVDGRRRGVTPLELEEVDAGRYQLRVEKDGYYPVRRWIEVPEAGSLVLEVHLEAITGFLSVDARPAAAELFVAGERLRSGFAELRVGTYELHARLFGYRTQTMEVRILENRVTEVDLELEPADFNIEDLSAWRPVFGPRNPGTTGTTLIGYAVTAPGRGELVIRADSGRVVLSRPQGPYTTWEQEYRWDGRDSSGAIVPDGAYRVELTAVGTDGSAADAHTTVTVDSSLVVRYRSVWSAGPGLLYAPTRNALPAAQVQATAQFAGIITTVDDSVVARFPGRMALRVGLGAGFELFGHAGFIAHSEPLLDRVSFGGAVAWDGGTVAIGPMDAGAGVSLGGTYRAPSGDGRIAGPDTQADYPGVFAAVPLSLRLGAVTVVLAPEYRFTVAPVHYGPGDLPDNSLGHIGYLRSGIVADLDGLSLGASAALRSRRFDEGFALDPPFQVGLEGHWVIPQSSVAISTFIASEITSAQDFYLMSGMALGVLF